LVLIKLLTNIMKNINKLVVITGSSKGIGKYFVGKLLENGHKVIGLSRSSPKIMNKNYKHIFCDLSDLKDVKKKTNFLKKKKVFTLIHNAGIHGPINKFHSIEIDKWVSSFNVNLFSIAVILKNIFGSFIKNKTSVIFLAGGGSTSGMKNFSCYSLAKTSLVRLCENLSIEYKNKFKFYCISPGAIRTDLLKNAIKNGDKVPSKKIIDVDLPWQLCNFLINNKKFNLSGRQIHSKDNYQKWDIDLLNNDIYKLRRIV